jgi:hypothetical protein
MSPCDLGDDMFRILATLVFASATLAVPGSAQEREWVLDATGTDAFLAFGVPNTNDVGVSFWCKIGHQEVSLFAPLTDANMQPVIHVVAGDKDFDLSGKVNNNDGAITIEALLVPQADILSAFDAAERFSVTLGKHRVTYPLGGADFSGLLKLCAGPPLPADN